MCFHKRKKAMKSNTKRCPKCGQYVDCSQFSAHLIDCKGERAPDDEDLDTGPGFAGVLYPTSSKDEWGNIDTHFGDDHDVDITSADFDNRD